MEKTVGKLIQSKRKQARITQLELSMETECTVDAIRLFERGVRVPSILKLEKIAKAFGCELIIKFQKQK